MQQQSAGGGIGFFSLLGLVFIVLKLTHFIDWPWIWVILPFLVPVALFVLFAVILAIVFLMKD